MCDTSLVTLPDWLGSPPYCPVCADAQAIIEHDRLQQKDKERVTSSKQLQIDRYLADSCIGERFRGKVFDDYKPVNPAAAKVLEVCRGFSAEFSPGKGKSLILIGSPGTGKNMLAAIIGQEVIKRGYSFLHTTALKVVRRYKDSWKQPDVTEDDVLRYFKTPDILAIDEIGVQFGSPTEQLYLTELINDRYEALKTTIMMANLTMEQIETQMGERSMERFLENGGQVLVFNWQSYRRQ